jgi:hypothetical protein
MHSPPPPLCPRDVAFLFFCARAMVLGKGGCSTIKRVLNKRKTKRNETSGGRWIKMHILKSCCLRTFDFRPFVCLFVCYRKEEIGFFRVFCMHVKTGPSSSRTVVSVFHVNFFGFNNQSTYVVTNYLLSDQT